MKRLLPMVSFAACVVCIAVYVFAQQAGKNSAAQRAAQRSAAEKAGGGFDDGSQGEEAGAAEGGLPGGSDFGGGSDSPAASDFGGAGESEFGGAGDYAGEGGFEGASDFGGGFSGDGAGGAAEVARPFTVKLLLVKADWSQAPQPEEIAAEMRKALKGASVPAELLDKLPASAVKILFPPELVTFYGEEHYAQLLAWMKARRLVVETIPFPAMAQPRFETGGLDIGGGTGVGFSGGQPYVTGLQKSYDLLDLPPFPQRYLKAKPFVKQEPVFEWKVFASTPASNPNAFQSRFRFALAEQARGEELRIFNNFGYDQFDIELLPGRVVLANAFISEWDKPLREAARRKGFEALIVVRRGEGDGTGNAKAAFHPPDKVQVPNVDGGGSVPVEFPPDETSTRFGGPRGFRGSPGGFRGFGADGSGGVAAPGGATPAASSGTTETPVGDRVVAVMNQGGRREVVFRLRHADASSLVSTLRQLFHDDVAVASHTGNQLIVYGPAELTAEVERLVAVVDRPSADASQAEPETGEGNFDMGGSVASKDVVRRQYQAAERKSQELAAECRKLAKAAGKSPADSRRLAQKQNELKNAVAESFALRQQLHRLELSELERQLEHARQTLDHRRRIERQIIDRRVRDLLDPELRWEAGEAGPSQQGDEHESSFRPAGASASPARYGPKTVARRGRDETQRAADRPTTTADSAEAFGTTEAALPAGGSAAAPKSILLMGHNDWVLDVAFSPDGKRLASSSRDKTIKLWDAETGRELRTLTGHTGYVEGVAFSPDGQHLASAGADETVRLWNAETGRLEGTLSQFDGPVMSVAFSPDGTRLASACLDGSLKIWDAATDAPSGTELLALDGRGNGVISVAFSPDGKRLASTSLAKTVREWDATTGALLKTLQAETNPAFSPDGKRLASTTLDKTVRVWDAESGRSLRSFKGHTDSITKVAFSPDGLRLASGSWDKTVRLWDVVAGRLLMLLKGHDNQVTSVAFSPDGKRLASAGADRTVVVWTLGEE